LVLWETNSHANSSPPLVVKAFVFRMLFCLEGMKKLVHYEFLTYFAPNVFTNINVQTSKKCGPNYGQNDVMKFLSKVLQSSIHM
jgi:hypothetical protein